MSVHLPLREYARPAKWRNAARRRVFRARLAREVQVRDDQPTTYLGTAYGGWPVPLDALPPRAVAYCVGAGADVSFDLELIRRAGCEVHSFDPTAGAAEHVAGIEEPRLHFHPFAIWTHDGEVEMFAAADPTHIAVSIPNLQRTATSKRMPCRTIESVRRELGHDRIDLVKLTVDGGEYDLVPTLDLDAWGTRVLVTAMHHNEPADRALALARHLRARGFEPVARKGPCGFTFLRTRELVRETPDIAARTRPRLTRS